MIKVGDLVMLKNANIRGPDGQLKKLEEAPDYGVVVSGAVVADSTGRPVCRVIWFDQETGARRGEGRTTIEFIKELEKISK